MRLLDRTLERLGLSAVPPPWPPRRLSLALQGGGSFGAFTWGALERLLDEPEISFDAISGVSAGAVNAVLLASGLMEGGREAAKARLERFWKRMSRAAALTPSAALAGLSLGLMTRALSPYLFNPFNLNPLREALSDEVDFERLRTRSPVRLLIGATRVGDGALRVFSTGEVSVDVVLASACLPLIHHAIDIDGEPYWDGGYSANPPLIPLVLASNAVASAHRAGDADQIGAPADQSERDRQAARTDPFQRDAQRRTRGAQIRHVLRRDAEAAPPAHRPHLGPGGIPSGSPTKAPAILAGNFSNVCAPAAPARSRPGSTRRRAPPDVSPHERLSAARLHCVDA